MQVLLFGHHEEFVRFIKFDYNKESKRWESPTEDPGDSELEDIQYSFSNQSYHEPNYTGELTEQVKAHLRRQGKSED